MALSSTDPKPESATSPEQTSFTRFRTVRSLLLCGASVRSLAESAISAGFRPLCVDFFQDQDLTELLAGGKGRFVARINSFRDLPKATHSVRSTIPMLWAGGLENHTDVLREIARRRPVIGADPDVIDRLRNPLQLHDWFTKAGLNIPRLASEATAEADCQWLRKPIASSGGMGIRTVKSLSLLETTNGRPLPPHSYLQEYIDGVPMSSVFCSDQTGVHLIGTSLQLVGWPCLGASDFLFCGNLGPVDPGEFINQQLQTAAATVVAQTGLIGVFGIDFILRQGQAWVIEVNPRITASHVIYEQSAMGSSSMNMTRSHLTAHGWQTTQPEMPSKGRAQSDHHSSVVARLIVWTPNDYAVPASLLTLFEDSSCIRVADRPCSETVVPAGSPICSLHISGQCVSSLTNAIGTTTALPQKTFPLSLTQTAEQITLLNSRFELNKISVPENSREPQGNPRAHF